MMPPTRDDVKLVDCSRCGTPATGLSHSTHWHLLVATFDNIPPLVADYIPVPLGDTTHYRPLCGSCSRQREALRLLAARN